MNNEFGFQYNSDDKLVRFSSAEDHTASPEDYGELKFDFEYNFLQYIKTVIMTAYSGGKYITNFENNGGRWTIDKETEDHEIITEEISFPYSYI